MKQILCLVILLLLYLTNTQAQYQEGLDPYFGKKGIVLTSGTKASYFGGVGLRGATLQPDGKIVAIATQRVSRYKENGDLDSTFGIDGVFEQEIYNDDGYKLLDAFYYAVSLQSDGKIIVAGYGDLINGPILLFRLTSSGFLDLTFGKNGVVCNNILGNIGATALAIQSDNKIVVTGRVYASDSQIIARYHSNGQIDSSFGVNGKAVNVIKGFKSLNGGDVSLMPDGRIVAMGNDFGVSRYMPNGTLDTTFNHTGLFLGYSGLSAPFSNAMCLRPDGKIWIAGNPLFDNPSPFLLFRLKENGTLDSTFNAVGYKQYDWDTGAENKCRDMLLLPDGKVVLGGRVTNKTTGVDNFGLIRIHSDGREDSTFGVHGRLFTQVRGASDNGDELYKLLLQSDNKILGFGNSINPSNPEGYAVIVRYYSNGKTGVSEVKKNGQSYFEIFPNPAKNFVHVNTTETIKVISISNLQGQLIKLWDTPKQNIVDITELPNGIYVLSIQTNSQIAYQKLIIQH